MNVNITEASEASLKTLARVYINRKPMLSCEHVFLASDAVLIISGSTDGFVGLWKIGTEQLGYTFICLPKLNVTGSVATLQSSKHMILE